MARLSLQRARPLALLLAGALLGASVSIVSGAIPSSAGQINACFAKTTGAIRVIDYPTVHCKSTEKFLRWNVKGVPGTAGTPGTPGGPPGVNGVSGFQVVNNGFTYEVKGANVDVVSDAVTCPAGKVAVGGGGSGYFNFTPTGNASVHLAASYPDPENPARWKVGFARVGATYFTLGDIVTFIVYATCITAS